MLVGIILQTINGNNPVPYYTVVGFPNETMEQLAGRLVNQRGALKKSYPGPNYTFLTYIGRLTHEVAPPPPPKPQPVVPIKLVPTALTGRKGGAMPGMPSQADPMGIDGAEGEQYDD
jgi:hypothetical protein